MKKRIQPPETTWRTTSSGGFPPIWKPAKEEEFLVIKPHAIREISLTKGKTKQTNYLLDGYLLDTSSENFFSGKNKAKIIQGELVSLPLNVNLIGEKALAEHIDGKMQLSKLSALAVEHNFPVKVIFMGTVPIGGGQRVKKFTVQIPEKAHDYLAKGASDEIPF